MNDDEHVKAMARLAELWGYRYEVTFTNGLWHARCRADGAEFHAASDQALHTAIWKHHQDGLPLLVLLTPAS